MQLKTAFFWNITTLQMRPSCYLKSSGINRSVTQRHTPKEKRTINRVNSEQHYGVSRTYSLYYYYVVASNVPGITLLVRNKKQYNHLGYISFKTAPLCNYTLLPATVQMLRTNLGVIL